MKAASSSQRRLSVEEEGKKISLYLSSSYGCGWNVFFLLFFYCSCALLLPLLVVVVVAVVVDANERP